jgi:hypothetical protein
LAEVPFPCGPANDCFLASRNDWGTYTRDIAAEKEFYPRGNLFVPQGDETCNVKPGAQPYVGCENALRQLEQLRYKTLNIGYERERVLPARQPVRSARR